MRFRREHTHTNADITLTYADTVSKFRTVSYVLYVSHLVKMPIRRADVVSLCVAISES